jgi:hypothetical protein
VPTTWIAVGWDTKFFFGFTERRHYWGFTRIDFPARESNFAAMVA